jgi:glycopeptide antibiotics resistance protein
VAAAALVAYLAVLAAGTLGASPGALFTEGAYAAQRIDGLGWLTTSDVERMANVLLFIPAGFLLCAVVPRTNRWLVWLACVAASAAVELLQYGLPGRDASPIDVVTNSTGAAIGVLLYAALAGRRRRETRSPRPPT